MKVRLGLCVLLPGLFGCSGVQEGTSARETTTQERLDFDLVGSRIIGCCCSAPCPCRINKKPTYCHGCDHTDAVHIERGHLGGARMDGLTWVFCGRGFGEQTGENWVVVYLDDRATPEQERALQEMLSRDVKALGAKAPFLAGAFKGIKRAPVTYSVSPDRLVYTCKIPGILDLRTHAIVNPGHREPVRSTGIMDAFGDRFVHAETDQHTYRDDALGTGYELTGRQANWADFHLTQDRVAAGGVGWGCWTAHATFDDKGPYQEQLGHHH